MGNRILICAIVLFALAFARANVYAQNNVGSNDGMVGKDKYQILLDEGIDSVLNSIHCKRADFRLFMDTVQKSDKDNISLHGHRGNGNEPHGIIEVNEFVRSYVVLGSSNNEEKGIYSVSVSGRICCFSLPDTTFSFKRSRKYDTIYEDSINNESKSFWDSTAKPILVTLGAAAVIALFFLVRG